MKDKILEILLKKWKSSPTAASEIADMVKAFTEWKDLKTIVQRQTRYTVKYHLLDMDAPLDLMTLDELFNYWYNNIREK